MIVQGLLLLITGGGAWGVPRSSIIFITELA